MSAPATLACPRCAAPLVTLAPGAAVGQVAVRCTRCGHWLTLGPGGAPPPLPEAAGWMPLPRGLASPEGGTGGRMGPLEWFAAAAGLLGGLVLAFLGTALASLRASLAGLGGELPRLTTFALSTRLPYLLAALAVGLSAGGVALRLRGLPLGRALLGAAVLVVLVGAPVCIISLYLPIFSLADAVR